MPLWSLRRLELEVRRGPDYSGSGLRLNRALLIQRFINIEAAKRPRPPPLQHAESFCDCFIQIGRQAGSKHVLVVCRLAIEQSSRSSALLSLGKNLVVSLLISREDMCRLKVRTRFMVF